ncbi:MAG: pantetheine-phosphate adenylyltransferase [Patescibacteria group bacterium]
MENTKQKKYTHAIVGGTFDHLHAGHRALLAQTFAHTEQITIGLATEKLTQHKELAQAIESYHKREQYLRSYLKATYPDKDIQIIALTDMFGNSLTDQTVDAIFVTEDTYPNAEIINKERETRNLLPLVVEIVPFVFGTDKKKITSERIRAGEIDREGQNYFDIFTVQKILTLPDELRETLAHPIGRVFSDMQAVVKAYPDSLFVSVGDIVSDSLREEGTTPAIQVIDLKTRRHALEKADHHEGLTAQNPAGTITAEAVQAYKAALEKYMASQVTQTVIVTGEEDLLALPAILLAPLQTVVLYGQYEQGVVVNEVTEEMKKKVINLLKKFS